MTPLKPDQLISVTLEAQQWNVVLGILAEGPFRVVNPVIGAIQRQCMEAGQPAPPLAPASGPPANGQPANSHE